MVASDWGASLELDLKDSGSPVSCDSDCLRAAVKALAWLNGVVDSGRGGL